jgi:integrase
MASITPRKNKHGEIISYQVRVSDGYNADGSRRKSHIATYHPEPGMTEKQIEKGVNEFAVNFEQQCRAGLIGDSKQKFQTYAEYCFGLWERNQTLKESTLFLYHRHSVRVFAGIGHLKISDIRPQHLNAFYEQLQTPGIRLDKDDKPLSASTIKSYHTFISAVLHQAVCEQLIPANPANRATLPKQTDKKQVDTFQPAQLAAILQAAESQPLKWKLLIHLLLATGCRRGEIIGLTWSAIDWTHNRIHITQTVSYNPQHGVFADSPKSKKAVRWIQLPPQTVQLLQEYREQYYLPLKAAAGKSWNADTDFVFVQDSGEHIGSVMHPHSVNQFLTAFSDSHDLPHIHPHKFRHSAASMLFYAGVDSVSIAGLLGHASPTITESIYAHLVEDVQSRAAQCIGNQIYMTANSKQNEQSDEQQTIKTG